MYGKIFDSMYDSTLADDWRALITFQQMIVLCDADGTVDMTPHSIARRTGIPIEYIEAGLKILEAPDPYSRTPDQDGRRIERIDSHRPWGWSIVNHEKYKVLQDADHVRAQTRERVRRHREKRKGVTLVTVGNAPKRHTDTDTDIKNTCARFGDFWAVWPKKIRKAPALKKWQLKKLDRFADEIIADVEWRKENYRQWQEGVYMHPATYLNQEAWTDEKETDNDNDFSGVM